MVIDTETPDPLTTGAVANPRLTREAASSPAAHTTSGAREAGVTCAGCWMTNVATATVTAIRRAATRRANRTGPLRRVLGGAGDGRLVIDPWFPRSKDIRARGKDDRADARVVRRPARVVRPGSRLLAGQGVWGPFAGPNLAPGRLRGEQVNIFANVRGRSRRNRYWSSSGSAGTRRAAGLRSPKWSCSS